MEQKALQYEWSLRRLQQEILAVNGRRYEASGRKPRIPRSLKSAVATVAHQIWSWKNWLDAYLGNPVSAKNQPLKMELQTLSGQMWILYESMTIGNESVAGRAGTWLHMAARTPHSIIAELSVEVVLTLLKSA